MNTEQTRATKMQLFAKIVNGFQMQSIFSKSYILDVRLGSGYASGKDNENTWVKKIALKRIGDSVMKSGYKYRACT